MAKGCDVKSICVLIQENQIKRDNLVIIGLTCQGIAGNSPQGYAEKCYSCQSHTPPIYDILIPSQDRPQEGLSHAPLKGEKRGVAGGSWYGSRQGKTDRPDRMNPIGRMDKIDRPDRMNQIGRMDMIDRPDRMNPIGRMDKIDQSDRMNQIGRMDKIDQSDRMNQIGRMDKIDQSDRMNQIGRMDMINQMDRMDSTGRADTRDQMDRIDIMDRMSSIERWLFWKDQFSRCIRCYACRNICPLCYCERCIADKSSPQWVAKGSLLGNLAFHVIRTCHLAARCIDCGECERVCPMGIPLTLLNRKMALVVKDLFQVEPGLSPGIKPFFENFPWENEQPIIVEKRNKGNKGNKGEKGVKR